MPGRSRAVRLAGLAFTTPLLVPSVSSRGFPLDNKGISQSNAYLHYAADSLDEALLVSAYDLDRRTLEGAGDLLEGNGRGTPFDVPRLLVVDSGGYETGTSWESGHVLRHDRIDAGRAPYDAEAFARVVDSLPEGRPALVVSYDGPDVRYGGYDEQRTRAQRFFAARTHLAADVLLKPPSGRWHSPRDLAPVAPDLVRFQAIGFTEKELGDSYLRRAMTLARLRSVLDDAGVHAPIHLFGSLDPLFTPLYFAAGAEIFDGLSWMRYAYVDGLAVHPDAGALMWGEHDDRETLRDARRAVSNLGHLRELKRQMERFAAPGSLGWDEFGRHGPLLSQTYATMVARIATGSS